MFGSKPRDASDVINAELQKLRSERDQAISERDAARTALSELRPIHCSFCGKSQHEVRKLIAGPTVFICDECVDLCVEIVKKGG